jgi:hypothetical protein
MAGAKWAHKIQLGRESTPGTAVAATAIWRGVGGNLQDTREVTMVEEQVGIAIPTTRNYIGRVGGSLSMAATPATYEQLLHILEAGIKSVGTGAADGSGSGKIYAYPLGLTAVNTIKTYTIETGDNQQAEEMEYCFVEKFTISGERGEAVMMSADWVGRQVTETTFTGALSVPFAETMLAGKGALYLDPIANDFGDTQVTDTLLSWELSVTTGWKAKYTVDSGQLYFSFHYFDRDSFSAELSATFEHNATAVAQKALFRAGTPLLFRLEVPGSALSVAGTAFSTRMLRIDMAAVYSEWDALDADEGNSIVSVKATAGYESTTADALSITVVTPMATVP